MSSILRIYSEDGLTLERTITDGLISGSVAIDGTPEADVDPPGQTRSLEWSGRQDLIIATARKRAIFAVDGTDTAAGVVVVCPPAGTMGQGPHDGEHLGKFSLAGLELIIQQTPAVPRFFPDFDTIVVLSQDIAKVAFRLANFSAPAGITVSDTNFPVVNEDIDGNFYRPEDSLAEALDLLASMVTGGASWWVDPSAALHFEAD